MSKSLFTFLALVSFTQAITVNRPNNAVTCKSVQISWSGGKSPYELMVLDSATYTKASIKIEGASNPYSWTPSQGTTDPNGYVVEILDATFDWAYSEVFTVSNDPSACNVQAPPPSSPDPKPSLVPSTTTKASAPTTTPISSASKSSARSTISSTNVSTISSSTAAIYTTLTSAAANSTTASASGGASPSAAAAGTSDGIKLSSTALMTFIALSLPVVLIQLV